MTMKWAMSKENQNFADAKTKLQIIIRGFIYATMVVNPSTS